MSKIDKYGLSSYQLKVFEICKSIYQNELFINNHMDNEKYQGYLIEANIIDKIKEKINYEKLEPIIANYFGGTINYNEIKKYIKDKKEQLKDIISKKYNNSSELIKELNKDKKFYLFKQEYLKEDNLKGTEIKYRFIKDQIILVFSDSDLLTFSLKKNGIIEKPFFINNSDDRAANLNNNISDSKTIEPKNSIAHIFKADLKILIRLYFYHKYLKEKKNDVFVELKQGNCETCYLINNSWIEEYKSFYDYQHLENYLMNIKELSVSFSKNNYYLSDDKLNQIIDGLPDDYTDKINSKKNFDKNKTFNYEIKESHKRIKYTYNNQIINSKIYELLTKSGYNLND